jgi:lambda family phage minor tail protein L
MNNNTINSEILNGTGGLQISPFIPTINQVILQSEAPAYLELLEIDCSVIGQPTYYLTNTTSQFSFGIDEFSAPRIYYPFPFQLTGIESNSDGAPARPTLDIGNLRGINGELIKLFGSLSFLYDDLVGVSVTYIRTFEPYINLTTRISAPPLKYFIGKKTSHNRLGLTFELRSPLDKERVFLPKRQMLRRDFPGLSINKHVG